MSVETTPEGFMVQPERWNDDVALELARADGLTELQPTHWKVLHFVRTYYREFGIAPSVRALCKGTQLDLGAIQRLFPGGPAKCACKIAGLPDSIGCI